MQIDREMLAWAGGFFEGEGSFYHHRAHVPRKDGVRSLNPGFGIPNTDREMLEKFQIVVGTGKIYGPYEKAGSNAKPMFNYRASGFEKTQAFLAMLWPWLSTRRRERGAEILKMATESRQRPPYRTACLVSGCNRKHHSKGCCTHHLWEKDKQNARK